MEFGNASSGLQAVMVLSFMVIFIITLGIYIPISMVLFFEQPEPLYQLLMEALTY